MDRNNPRAPYDCPECDGRGWRGTQTPDGEPTQEQCAFCQGTGSIITRPADWEKDYQQREKQAKELRAELAEAREDRDRYKRALEWAVLREPTGMRVALAATEDDD